MDNTKNELFQKIDEVVSTPTLNSVFEQKYKDILDKHDVENINSNISEKISDVKDPLERAVVAYSLLEDLVKQKLNDDKVNMVNNHRDLLKLFMMLNRSKMKRVTEKEKEGCLVKANDYFDKYITNFK